jgi:hypothetical protein
MMRAIMGCRLLWTFSFAAVLLPISGTAQMFQTGTPPPPATAEYADWQFNSEPLLVNGLIYYPTRETRLFDSQIMVQTGAYRSVPIYADVTKQPFGVVYVPIGRGLMKAYEVNPARDIATIQPPRNAERTVGTSGAVVPAPVPTSARFDDVPRPARTRMESARRPEATNGVWLEFQGVRYYAEGAAVAFDANRFTPIGDYRGFPVFRAKDGRADQIWVSIVMDGPLAPYTKR